MYMHLNKEAKLKQIQLKCAADLLNSTYKRQIHSAWIFFALIKINYEW